jgi:DNA-binding NarL/FixJ family response regulator
VSWFSLISYLTFQVGGKVEEEVLKQYLETLNLRLIRLEQMVSFLVSRNRTRRPLTPRQQQVLELKKQGLKDKEVSERLGLSRSYVTRVVGMLRRKGLEV